ncbi:MAG: 3-phosphoshikimate 1-carboxyvinyltransferase [Myxococcota bacterium]|nr:3-phosphoshikimate 1-carboxyvinyltransferase [Myxococcota bacterium]
MPAKRPDIARVRPRGPLDARIRPPGSKSITNRALVAAALAAGESQLDAPLASDDTEAMRECLARLGVEVVDAAGSWHVRGRGGRLRAPDGPLDARASGTTARFLTAAAALADGPVVIDGAPRMRERPIDDLTQALEALGVEVEVLGRGGCPPVRVAGAGLPGGRAAIDASRSSQFVTAVLLAAPYAKQDVRLEPRGGFVISRPYVDLTLQVMAAFGAEAAWTPDGALLVASGRPYRARQFAVEPDASAAAYPFAAAAIAGGRVVVEGFPADSIQADLGLLAILEQMGCTVSRGAAGIEVCGPAGALRGVDVDMNDLPDAVLALAVVALFAEGATRIRNVPNLRIKETDRLAALECELRKLGARAESGPDWLTIAPGALRPAAIDTYDDHRMAMAFALAGLRVPGVEIRDPDCVAKTWPDYFAALERL